MAEGDADQVKPEMQTLSRVERIKAEIGKWVESQMPPAVGERYKKTFTVFAERLAANRPELLAKLQSPIETAAKVAGLLDPVIKVAVGAAALYGGVTLLLRPDLAVALGSSAVVLGKNALAAGSAAAVGVYKFVETGVKESGKRIKIIFDRLTGFPELVKDDFAGPYSPLDKLKDDMIPKVVPKLPIVKPGNMSA